MESEAKKQALEQIKLLINENKIAIHEVNAIFLNEKNDNQSVISRVFAYIGAALIMAGIGYVTATFWGQMGGFSRILITLGTGIACFIIAFKSAQDERYNTWHKALFSIAVGLQPFGLGVAIKEIFGQINDAHLPVIFICVVMAVQQFLAYRALKYNNLLLFSLFFAFFGITDVMDWLDIPAKYIGLSMGASMIMISVGLRNRLGIEAWGYFFGSLFVLASWFELVRDGFLEVSFLGLCAGMIYLSTLKHQNAMLYVSSFSLMLYIGYFSRNFLDSFGWPIFLIIMGVCFFAISRMVMKLRSR
jgi:hypothetical protein